MDGVSHTPGPWTVADDYGKPTGVRAGDPKTGRRIASTWVQARSPRSADAHASQVAQNNANARLIAAAPELYAAALKAIRFIRSDEEGYAELRAAIAKAEGR